MTKEELKKLAAGHYYHQMKNTVGTEKLTDHDIDIFVDGAMFMYDLLNKPNPNPEPAYNPDRITNKIKDQTT